MAIVFLVLYGRHVNLPLFAEASYTTAAVNRWMRGLPYLKPKDSVRMMRALVEGALVPYRVTPWDKQWRCRREGRGTKRTILFGFPLISFQQGSWTLATCMADSTEGGVGKVWLPGHVTVCLTVTDFAKSGLSRLTTAVGIISITTTMILPCGPRCLLLWDSCRWRAKRNAELYGKI